MYIAVSNSFKGKGLGGKMLNECIKPYIASHGGGLITFNTNAEDNRSFYRKNGFTEIHEMTIRANG
ncbi:GNAT family N-acetyltransferase [Paenibacillus terrae]